jgi:hypothetical protein
MANQIGISGGQPQKPTRFAPIYVGRWSSGLWTNRSPLRDANTSRMQEKFYGPAGDALIDGSNVEITNRLTLARRPGNPIFDSNSYNGVDSFYSFRMFAPNKERINVMIDEANTLSSLYSGTKTTVFTKSTGAGQAFMQGVGNSLYFGDGVDNKKWLQSLVDWSANASWNGPTTPFLTTYFIDPNGNIQQLTATAIPIDSTQFVTADVVTVNNAAFTLTDILAIDQEFTFPAGMSASYLSNQTVTITSVSAHSFTASGVSHATTGVVTETNKYGTIVAGGTPISASTQPTWSTTSLTPGMATPANALTLDGTALWTNRGNPVYNWGIQPPTATMPTPSLNSSRVAWAQNTFYSNASVIVDSNGNLQQVTVDGTSGASTPSWATSVSATTTDGTVTWTCIQLAASLTWAAHTTYAPGAFLVANSCLFRAKSYSQPVISTTVDWYRWYVSHSGQVGSVIKYYPTTLASADQHQTGNSMDFDNDKYPDNLAIWNQLNSAGETTSTTTITGDSSNWNAAYLFNINIPVAGQYAFTMIHHDGAYIGFGGAATKVSGVFTDAASPVHTSTFVNNYPIIAGKNGPGLQGGQTYTTTFVVNFPTAGDYPVEVDHDYWYHSTPILITLTCNGNKLFTGTPESGTTEPVWPSWVTTYAPNYPTISESQGHIVWENLGPITDFTWHASTGFTLPEQQIVDTNGNLQEAYRTGVTGAVTSEPTTWATGFNQLTNDNPNLVWINKGPATSETLSGTLSAFSDQGWEYAIALVNTLDDTVSNCGKLSAGTGKVIGAKALIFSPGAGLPDPSLIDPQADYVAIFRTTDGQAVPFLIPGTGNSIYTISLADYLANGYSDTTPDTSLDNLIQGAISGENTPPAGGAKNLTYHLNRIFFSVGNIVYWTTGPDAPVGNGLDGVAPLNFDEFPSLVNRIVPLAIGALVFTVSGIYLIPGQGNSSSPIQAGQSIPYLQKIGLLSYNALDINGSIIGLYTADKQFIILDPSSGVSYVGFPIGDRFRKNDGNPGTSWDASKVYVTWHTEGEDQAWYVSDGANGWYRLVATPAPEQGGYTWSPFASLVGGAKAVQSVEVSPGSWKLLTGPTASGPILNRDLDVFQDNSSSYAAWAVIGSAMLAQPGQVALVSFITTDSVRTGTPMVLGILIDEAWPYFNGSFELLKDWTNDPPGLHESKSIIGQRFYLSDSEDHSAACRHMQMQINWSTENAANELLSLTIFGAYNQEL